MRVLVTGGAGYIGSHTCVELLAADHEVCVVDNLCNGHIEAIECVRRLSNKAVTFFEADIRDEVKLDSVFKKFKPEAVIHFAGLKAVGDSVVNPMPYYEINVVGSAHLLAAMDRAGCVNIVFSSSASVYGEPDYLPYDEFHPTRPVSPYGRTKLMVEDILRDWATVGSLRHATALRYFNPVGAHPSAEMGEDPCGIPDNLMPYIAQTSLGKLKYLKILGNNYDTHDGTGIRDYIHVTDLARAHVAAIEKQIYLQPFEVINLGSGLGTSVLELVEAFEKASGVKIELKICPPRDGDVAKSWANATAASYKLGWKTSFSLREMCRDTWAWQKNNPTGYVAEGA